MNGKTILKSDYVLLLCGLAAMCGAFARSAGANAVKPGAGPKPVPKVVVLTRDDNNKVVKIQIADVVRLRLDSNATTGYSWIISKNDAGKLKPAGKPHYENPRDAHHPPLAGAGGAEVFEFSAVKKGAVRLQLQYRRPWEKKEAPADVYAVKVVIR